MKRFAAAVLFAFLAFAPCAFADDMSHMDHSDHSDHTMGGMEMNGMLGNYPMSRESAGTSWQPESSPPMGTLHGMAGDWMWMAHGFANAVYTDQGGSRGEEKFFGQSMFMGMAQRPLGPGTLGFDAMFSLDPLTIHRSYPLLLQTGETANGHDPLIDRQHPHDFFTELAASYALPVGAGNSLFFYFGLPGEPALGPSSFMHRVSGMDSPEAPISHHWLDSTHITFGVATLGVISGPLKVEGSIFTGREPDEDRWDIERPRFDSYSGRITLNPTPNWSFQVSGGYLKSPEALEQHVNVYRGTASATYNLAWDDNNWQTTAAIGLNVNDPGQGLPAALLESAVTLHKTHTFFGRVEGTRKDELFDEHSPRHGDEFDVGKISLGYVYDFPAWHRLTWGVGAMGSVSIIPGTIRDAYGDDAPLSFTVFARVKL